MRGVAIVSALVVSVSALVGCAGSVDSESAESADPSQEAISASPKALDVRLFKAPNGLEGCAKAELVTHLEVTHGLMPTYPVKYFRTATLSSFYAACAGIPVPLVYMQGPTVALERLELGCGSVLLRGDLPAGGRLEIFDHRNARRGWGCGAPSVNPIIVRTNGALSYAVSTKVTCESLAEAACSSRSDCHATLAYLPIAQRKDEEGEVVVAPRPVFTGCVTNPTVEPEPVAP